MTTTNGTSKPKAKRAVMRKPVKKDTIYKLSNGGVIFDYTRFLSFQHEIASKYECKEGLDLDFIGETEWTRKFDAYLLHALEECAEVYDEFKYWDMLVQRSNETIAEEIVDVAMYLGSLDLLLHANIKKVNDDEDEEEEDDDDDYVQLPRDILQRTSLNVSLLKNNIENIKKVLLDLISRATMLRRDYPARKWHKHKPSDDRDSSEMQLIIEETREKVYQLIMDFLVLALAVMDFDPKELNLILENKQAKVLKLKRLD